ncbi:peptidase [Nonlabens spongiae]|uniref:Peptidase n=1 Tax=Nonlabens spongiae TaxID=331648 RepID=A0A1W6MIJ3_9FLAO|nr:slipin family protein [Nonlabens spongiae]ARN77434.1 peptidase [Nonlabens spongiae]
MKISRKVIKTGTVGLVFKDGEFVRMLNAGVHWVRFRESVKIFYMTAQLKLDVRLEEVLLKDAKVLENLHVVDVGDGELVFKFVNNIYSHVLTTGRYLYWKGFMDYKFVKADLSKIEITEDLDSSILSRYGVNQYVRTFEVGATEKGVLLVEDKFDRVLESGVYRFWKNDISIKFAKTDTRTLQMEVSGQELLTKDKASIRTFLFAKYRVVDVKRALMGTKDFEKQFYVDLQLALRGFVGNFTLDELLESKEDLAASINAKTVVTARDLGIELLDVGVRDIILTGEMKEIMNKVLMAQKTAQANVITRREETASTRSLLNTAKLMEENAMLYKLKEMEYVEKIADKIGEITVTGNGGMVGQLKEIFAAGK